MRRRPVTDHRGQLINLFGLPGRRPRDETRLSIPKDVHRKIERRIGYRLHAVKAAAFLGSFVLCLVVMFLGTVLLTTLFNVRVSQSTVQLTTLALFLVTAAITAFTQEAAVHRIFAPRIIGSFLAERRCPACAYDLAGGVVGEDGCTVCPECSAAWRLESTETASDKPA